jgi:DNA repair exonuclease SbcCD ATPase subunit
MPAADLRKRYDAVITRVGARQSVVQDMLTNSGSVLAALEETQVECAKVIEVLAKVGELSRGDTITKLEKLISYALQTILDEPTYEFMVTERELRGTIAFEFMYSKFGNPPVYLSEDSSGGGVCDIVSTFLAIIIPIFVDKKARRFVVLDERFKCLSDEYLPRIAQVLKFLQKRLKIQFVIITQHKELKEAGDKVYYFSNTSGETTIKDITNV